MTETKAAPPDSTSAILAQHDVEIRKLTQGQDIIFSKLDALAVDGKQVNAALGQISQSLVELRVQKGPPWHQIISATSQLVMVIGGIFTGIIYLSRSGQSPEMHAVDKRVSAIEMRAEWEKDLAKERAKEGDRVAEHRLKRIEDDVKQLRSAQDWKPVISSR